MSKIFKLNWKDLVRGLIVVLLAALLSIPVSELANYIDILQNPVVAMVVSTIFGYLSKNLLTDENGKLLGVVSIK